MRTLFSALLAASLLAGLLIGCSPAENSADSPDGAADSLEKPQDIEFQDGEGNLLCTLTDPSEIEPIWELLDETDWEPVDVSEDAPESGLPVELVTIFTQRPTQTVLGPKVEDEDREEIMRLTVYEGSDTAALQMPLFQFSVQLTEGARETLRSAAGLPSADAA